MILTHWSRKPLGELHSVEPAYRDGVATPHAKPRGFWLSDESGDDGWSQWCESGQYNLGQHRTEFDVDLTHIRHLSGEADLIAFTSEFGEEGRYGPAINWPAVGATFKGVVVTPYVWSQRLTLDWYYTWDCASGVFWDVSCLRRLSASRAA